MVIYIVKKIVIFLLILFLLIQISFCLAYLTPHSALSHLGVLDAYDVFFSQLQLGNLHLISGEIISFQNTFFATFELCLLTLFVSLFVGIPIGIFAGLVNIRFINNIIQTFCLIIYSFPLVWIGTMALFFASPNGVTQIDINAQPLEEGISLINLLMTEQPNKFDMITEQLHFLLLPILILAIQPSVITIQLISQNVKKTARQNYIKMAIIRETSSLKILRRHLLPNAIPTTIPQLTYNITTILFSAIVIEILFGINGIGKWIIQAYQLHEYTILAIAALSCGVFISLSVLVSEIFTMVKYPMHYKENYA